MSTASSTASTRPSPRVSRPSSRRWVCGLAALALTLAAAPQPARAQWAVYDAKADVEAMLSAARQIESLANETRALANQARSLAASPYSHLAESSERRADARSSAQSSRCGAGRERSGLPRRSALSIDPWHA